MKTDSGSAEIHLQEHRPLRLYHAQGMKVSCTAGMVWITSAKEAADIFLSAGQSYRGQRNGLTLIEGIGEGWIRLERDEQPSTWRHLLAAARRQWRKRISRTNPAASAPDFPA